MTSFSEFAPAKINLALHVLGRRADGFHQLDSIVAFADVGDELRFTPAAEFSLTVSGPFATALPTTASNIILRARTAAERIATARGRKLPGAAIHLVKNLPVASGIGGGSADAAAALRGLLRLAGIAEYDEAIMVEALTLGADVPVCLLSKACRMQGVGELITPLENFAPLHAVLVNPGVEVSTADVFRGLGLNPGESCSTPIADPNDPATWRNDLTTPAVAIAPAIAEVLEALRSQPGITSACMSGSGATCFAVFDKQTAAREAVRRLALPTRHWWICKTTLD
ncbi:MAG: 4-(cytidine 5'-diphospho)-2-C-methyl-D-erythritol kinase [Rhizobiales bacterium]|nr:4-(cytidine 5'-diphospho)-2-C-methyl-D-erythritol kinase [Hyphomicrobiales bacterium]MBI3674336.1 4-(cytidine 5'-diphospho)-2-C-methyl-D-erythritol kinase [Hyphomicrobiales bacterium]